MNRPSTTIGKKTLRANVKSPIWKPRPDGTSRSAPSAKPIYQSGWVPAEMGDGSYGPYNQIGLMVKNVAISTITPNTMKKNPPAFAANTGMIGTPTTLSLVDRKSVV